MSLHCMIDLETLDTQPTAVVLSIGAVLFDPNGDYISEPFFTKLFVDDQVKAGRTKSRSTMEWWAAQSDAAREAAFGDEGKRTPNDALDGFDMYLRSASELEGLSGVWGNGASFDNVILTSLYRSFGKDAPWPFWMDRCFRTMKNLGRPAGSELPKFEGTPHNPVDDAVHQVRCLQAITKATRAWVQP